ncbi:hypothetical protein [Actinomyces gerencseriae]|uniref:hypothetical protein n=1 Tax=Actinomyces gerencseriae TaxID=52769 RepID=UPI0028E90BA7|nr:hypothetical protein [Actinomyces gerencseriae]
MALRRTAALTIALTILLTAACGTTSTTSHETPATATDTTTEAASAATAETASDPGASVCGMDPGDQAEPTGDLGQASIRIAAGLTVPNIDGIGPGITDGITRCFAHSPKGATIAAANFMKWLSSNQQLPQVTETLIAAGLDRDRMLNEVHTSWDGSTTDAVHIVGYKTEVRGPDEVLVNIAISQPSDHSVLTGWPLVMTWQDGDWKVKPPSNDSWGEKGVKNNSLTEDGYQKWSA